MSNPKVYKKEGETIESGKVIQNIVVRPVQRNKADIMDWRNRHQHAEGINGVRVDLYDLYDDVLLDGFLNRMMKNRILGVTKNRLRYVDKKGVEIKVENNIIDLLQFKLLREAIQLQKAWGISVIELMNDNGKLKFFDVPKKHILPKDGIIVNNQYDNDGISYRNPPYNKTVIEIGKHDDLGYLLIACPYVIYKRGDIADWANYAQIFGMPFREARYDGFNEMVRLQLEQALEKAASAAWAVLPKDAEFKLHEAKSGANSNELYNTLRQAMNEEIMVAILGATETTISSKSSGYAQSEIHKNTVDEQTYNDMAEELCILNDKLLPVMIYLGLLPANGKFEYCEPMDIAEAVKKINLAQKVKAIGLPLNDDNIYEMSGLKKPVDYSQQKKKIEQQKQRLSSLEIEGANEGENLQLFEVIKKWFRLK